jgi:acetolactate synthase-1/2/3 large subunit
VGHRLAEALRDCGTTHVFGVPGGQTLPLYEGIMDREGIEHVLVRDERSAGFAADAYARLTGRIGVCDATVGPGATNLPSAVAECLTASVPLLAIVSDLPRAAEHRRGRGNASQGLPQLEMLAPIAKWAVRLTDPEALDETLAAALRIAATGRPGPVVLAIPEDVFRAPAAAGRDFGALPRTIPWHRPGADPAAVARAAALLRGARRPAVLAGGGVVIAGAEAELAALAERLGAPVATTVTGKNALPEDHPLSLGVAGTMGNDVANATLAGADVLLLAGTKAGQGAMLGYSLPAEGTTVIHLDVDPEEIGRNVPGALALVADARLGLAALVDELGAGAAGAEWDAAALRGELAAWRERERDPARARAAMLPQRVVALAAAGAGPGDVAVSDASLASGWTANHFDLRGPAGRRSLAPRGLAGLGWGAAAAVGAACALSALGRSGRVVHVAGDGGLAYSVAELEVMARLRLPVTNVVLDNRTLAWIKHSEQLRFGDRFISADFAEVDFARVASGFGVPSRRVETEAELEAALAESREASGPFLIDALVDEWETPVVGRAKPTRVAATPAAR